MTTCGSASCGPCAMGCAPDQYFPRCESASVVIPSYQGSLLIYPTLPAGCARAPAPAVLTVLEGFATTCPHTYYLLPLPVAGLWGEEDDPVPPLARHRAWAVEVELPWLAGHLTCFTRVTVGAAVGW